MSFRRALPAAAVVALAAAGTLLTVVGHRIHALGLLQAAAGSVALVGCSALALNGSRPRPLPTRRAVRTVLATTAANALTPAGMGGALLTVRVHTRTGLSGEQAAAATALRAAAGAAVALIVTAVTAGTAGVGGLPVPRSGPVLLAALLAAIATVGLVVATVPAAGRLVRMLRRTTGSMGAVCRRPRSCAALLLGCLGVTAAQLVTLDGAVRAVGGHLGLSGLLVALLGSAAARSALPSPGGVGPIEAALVGGLTGLGMHLAAATVAVMVYRTAGHWLPTLAGTGSIRHLRRQAVL